MKSHLHILYYAIIILLCLHSCKGKGPSDPTVVFPQSSWEESLPERHGFSSKKLDEMKTYITENCATTGMMIAVGGEVIFKYGDCSEISIIASCRKSLLSILYGKYVEDGTINLSSTLASLGIDDIGGLLPIEKTASVENIISSRSGVYHLASNSGDDLQYAPQRGSQTPGNYFLYNNWDFNVAGTIYEQIINESIYTSFKNLIADPVGMEDYIVSKQVKGGNLSISQFPAYHFYLSTRDMARIGYLMLRKGEWDGSQIISADWVGRMLSIVTPREEMHPDSRKTGYFNYGYMWWLFDYDANDWFFSDGYTAWGADGQYITVLPKLDMVIAHKTSKGSTSFSQYYNILKKITYAKI